MHIVFMTKKWDKHEFKVIIFLNSCLAIFVF